MDAVFVVKRDADGQEQNLIKNLGTLFAALIGISACILLVLLAGLIVRYVKM